ncbi:MAG: prepilin-type N-terminal cleavage/methylation domain-containing protein [Candidatus Paceibacterota bacterium]
MYKLEKSRGFTLIELLVVIAIIGLLSSVVMVSLDQARGRARDTRRISEIEQLIRAVEMYKINKGVYPGEGDTGGAEISPRCPSDFKEDLQTIGYLKAVPEDPKENLGCSEGNVTQEKFFYAWDYEVTAEGTHCIGINRLETEWAVNLLADKYPDNDGDISNGIQYSTGGGDYGIGTGGDFNYCFEKND